MDHHLKVVNQILKNSLLFFFVFVSLLVLLHSSYLGQLGCTV